MTATNTLRVERLAMTGLLACLFVFAFWTLGHQLSTFVGISWTSLLRATAWSWWAVALVSGWASASLARTYAAGLPVHATVLHAPLPPAAWVASLAACILAVFAHSYALRFALLVAAFGLLYLRWGTSRAGAPTASPPHVARPHPAPSAVDWLCLLVLMAAAVLVVVCANRSDFDDAEYLQSAIQTLRHPDRALFTFDASLGIVLEPFRFAPYRLTSYETFVGLLAQASGMDILDVYYVLVPGVAAALSVLTAFVFLRWFVPRRWAVLGVALCLAITLAWGESHVAFGNREYVRLFQGKGLLIAITTPMAIAMALLWMRKPGVLSWLGLLVLQIVAVGVSSSGLVITLFATAIGLLGALLAQPTRPRLLHAALGGLTLAYPIGLGLWLKYASSASGKVEEIGTYLPINASFGSPLREVLAMVILGLACAALARSLPRAAGEQSASVHADRTAFWLVASSFLLALNPFLIASITQATSRNMNWRLAWAAPVPLLLALGMVTLWQASTGGVRRPQLSRLGALALCSAFFLGGAWTLAPGNKVGWGWAERKLPPEYHQAFAVAADIRRSTIPGTTPMVLVDPRLGTWLTVVAPDFRLVMPGHGYLVTLPTILDPQDVENRLRMVNNIGAIVAGDRSLDALLDRYGVDTIVVPPVAGASPASPQILRRAVVTPAAGQRAPGAAVSARNSA